MTERAKLELAEREIVQLPSGGGFKKFWKLDDGLKPIPNGWGPKPFEGIELLNLHGLPFCGGVIAAIENELTRGNRRYVFNRMQRKPHKQRRC